MLDILALKRKDESAQQYNNSEKKPGAKHQLLHDSIHTPVRVSHQEKKLKMPEKPVQSRILVERTESDKEVSNKAVCPYQPSNDR